MSLLAFRRPIATALATTAIIFTTAACGSSPSASTDATGDSAPVDAAAPLTILASPVPHLEILEHLDEINDSFTLDIKTVTDVSAANMAVADGSVDANFFQHVPYLRDWEAQTGKQLVNLASVHLEPTSMYSEKITSADQIPDGADIVVPSSPSNLARGLLLLEKNGLITLDADLDPEAVTSIDLLSIKDNPRNLNIVPVEDLMVLQSIRDNNVYGVIAASSLALESGYDPVDDAVLSESPENNPYVNVFVASQESAVDPRVKDVAEALQSNQAAEWIREEYGNAVLPVN
ncbi:MetQ/NlpA family ABC transporter substrate-binding protein [Corynebacterium sp. HMSC29G08]|uniref:MetQ/NlpA family ABC transporter substrate-binding protein n=1 Tax=Corynebacterium sp. HMSC29G08 TaxID=1581069 RepID=UPI0009F385BC|nr:MetQ/NlpA family ABC transporter substrate-binding protein [Corynebacterium sp. HMSC29G08]